MIQIKYIKDMKGHGEVVNISEAGANSAVSAGVAEYIKEEKKYNFEDVIKFYKHFNHNYPSEIIVFDKVKYPNGKVLWAKDENEFQFKVQNLNEDEKVDVYIGGRDRTGTGNENVVSSGFIFVEIDEHNIDKPKEAPKLKKLLKENGISLSMVGRSGGGYHFYIPHKVQDLTDINKKNIYLDVLTKFKKKLLSSGIDIDPKVFDLQRVSRVLGTWNYKRNALSKILYYNLNVDLEKNTEAINRFIENVEGNIINKKEEVEALPILEKYGIDKIDKWLYEVIKNKVLIKEDTGGNSCFLKNTAIICLRESMEEEEINIIGSAIVSLCEGRTLSAFKGWIAKGKDGSISEVNKLEIDRHIEANNYPLTTYTSMEAISKDVSRYSANSINVIDDFDKWKPLKKHMSKIIGEELFFLSHSKDKLKGKLEPLYLTMKSCVLIQKAIKRDDEGNEELRYFFLDDMVERGFKVKDSLALDFWMYKLVEKGKEYLVLSESELGFEEYSLSGMIIKLKDVSEASRTLKLKSLSSVFIVCSGKSSVETLEPEVLVEYVKTAGWNEEFFKNFIYLHPDGNVYRHIPLYEDMRVASLLSGKFDDFDLHTLTLGASGTGKSMEEEALSDKFREPIFEAGSSRLKGLIPSFKEKPANSGFLAQSNRVALVDELFKMIEREYNQNEHSLRSSLGEMNCLLEQKERIVGSGNSSLKIKSTAKVIFVSNPLTSKDYLNEHLGVIDITTLARMLIWVMDKEHRDKVYMREYKSIKDVFSEELSKCYGKDLYTNSKQGTSKEANKDKFNVISFSNIKGVCRRFIDDKRPIFLTIFDSSRSFVSDIDIIKVKNIFRLKGNQFKDDELKTLWTSRGLHHSLCLLDGIVKARCLFRDYDSSFIANEEDYIKLTNLLDKILSTWTSRISSDERNLSK